MAEAVRLQKALADAGVASRRQAEALIAAGRVAVNGQPATIGQKVDPARDRLTLDGRPLAAAPPTVHLLLAKPAGVTSTVADRHARRTVLDLVPPELRTRAVRLYPVGRLDRDSEGLVLLTNDGEWAQRVLHPRHEVEREYAVAVARPLGADQLRALTRGVELEEGLARAAGLRRLSALEVRVLSSSIGSSGDLVWYRAILRQGWKRQLRRMFASVGAPVERLVRVRFGNLQLAGMPLGELRELPAAEAAALAGEGTSSTESGPRRGARQPTGRRLVVAIDGPGGSGKSTVGAGAARRLGYRFCDTGVLYRGLTWLAIDRGVDPDDEAGLVALVPHVELVPDADERYVRLLADGREVTAELHTAAVDRDVSRVSRHAPVRAALLPIQRALAAAGGIIMAGRDIGTVVLPDADLKIYLDVSLEERARRRAAERGVAGDAQALATITAELRRRDGVDSTRAVAPLRRADDAVVIDTEANTLAQTVDQVVRVIEQAAGGDR
jgi:cytidylate kinase